MKKVLLIYPPSPPMNREGRCQQLLDNLVIIPKLPPIELMYLAAVAENNGFECKIKDYSCENETLEDLKKDLLEFKPDIVISNVATPTANSDCVAFDVVKSINKDTLTIAMGAYFLLYAKNFLNKQPSIDCIIKGETEATFDDLLKNGISKSIKGLLFRENQEVIENEERPFIQNLDELPFPARNLVDNTKYTRPDNSNIQTIIKVARGCPFHCFFCLATPVSGAKVRMRSPQNIMQEIKECVEKYNITNFVFWSDIFDFDKAWVLRLCDEIISSGVKITWSSNTRADLFDEELAKKMYKSGCRLVSMGFESGSQEILDKMGKGLTLEKSKDAIKVAKKAGLEIYGYFVLGLPWENKSHINATIDFSIKSECDYVSYYVAVPFKGSRFYDYVKQNNLEDLSQLSVYKNSYSTATIKTHFLSKEEVDVLYKKAMKKFYLRPSYILKKLMTLKSFQELKNYIKAGLSVLRKNAM
ncbi:MAG: radical SAM protein [Candidatus Gastranaerophilales bacterium]|nr:radical SAM protein [Candidatus Gastranaerophilales bacterium]